jgi:3-phenylpropionate/trans-cinnamate dioxygenase ferredoxin subunit
MSEYVVANVEDVPEGTHIVVKARDREIGIFNVRGSYYAIPNTCFHQNGPVCLGTVTGAVVSGPETGWKKAYSQEGEIVVCPWHALEFNVTTGQCLAYANKRLKTYPVRVENNEIRVEM